MEPTSPPNEPDFDDLDLNLTQKKKKKKPAAEPASDEKVAADDEPLMTYHEMLSRLFQLLPKTDFSKVAIPPPTVSNRSRSTTITNFSKICHAIRRAPQHVMKFIASELRTTASENDETQLVLRGRFVSAQIQTILRQYIKKYVECRTCHCIDTKINKSGNVYFMTCNKCEATSSWGADSK